MNKLAIKDLIEFRRKSDRSKKKFVADLKKTKKVEEKGEDKDDGGGDYWITSLSAISNCYRQNELKIINKKIKELEDKQNNTTIKNTKTMYQRNIDILYQYENFDFKKWQLSKKVSFLHKPKNNSILTIKELQIKATPHHVFAFKKDDISEVGAVWFIAKLGGFTKDELGMFTDILYQYLKTHFANDYVINPKYCLAVDVVSCFDINYSQIQEGNIPAILTPTLNEIRRLM